MCSSPSVVVTVGSTVTEGRKLLPAGQGFMVCVFSHQNSSKSLTCIYVIFSFHKWLEENAVRHSKIAQWNNRLSFPEGTVEGD